MFRGVREEGYFGSFARLISDCCIASLVCVFLDPLMVGLGEAVMGVCQCMFDIQRHI